MEPISEAAAPPIKTLLVGMGNPYLSDDAVGIHLVRDFSQRLGSAPNLEVIEECSVGGLNLLDLLDGFERLIIVDSIKTKGGSPGNWYRFTAKELRETMNLSNIHDANFATTLELGRRMGMTIPPESESHIFAVEILDNLTFSERLTDDLERSYPVYSEEIFHELRSLINPKPLQWNVV
jgi:hydrogenase maturation protease